MKKILLVSFFLLSASSCGSFSQMPSKRLLDDIILRFYHVQRLTKGVERLVWMSHKKLVPLCLHCEIRETKNSKTLVLSNDEEIVFTHERIIWCIEHIEKYHSLAPFLEVWEDLTHYQLVRDKTVLREFTYLLFYLYKDVVHQEVFLRSEKQNLETLESILIKAPSLEKAELEEILDVLDILVDELPAFIEQYELASNLTWQQWLKKYWLIAPVAAAILVLKIYLGTQAVIKNTHQSVTAVGPNTLI